MSIPRVLLALSATLLSHLAAAGKRVYMCMRVCMYVCVCVCVWVCVNSPTSHSSSPYPVLSVSSEYVIVGDGYCRSASNDEVQGRLKEQGFTKQSQCESACTDTIGCIGYWWRVADSVCAVLGPGLNVNVPSGWSSLDKLGITIVTASGEEYQGQAIICMKEGMDTYTPTVHVRVHTHTHTHTY